MPKNLYVFLTIAEKGLFRVSEKIRIYFGVLIVSNPHRPYSLIKKNRPPKEPIFKSDYIIPGIPPIPGIP